MREGLAWPEPIEVEGKTMDAIVEEMMRLRTEGYPPDELRFHAGTPADGVPGAGRWQPGYRVLGVLVV